MVLSRFRATSSTNPSSHPSPGENTMKTNFRPFLKIEVAEPAPTIGILYFSVTLATGSAMSEPTGPRTRSTFSRVMSRS